MDAGQANPPPPNRHALLRPSFRDRLCEPRNSIGQCNPAPEESLGCLIILCMGLMIGIDCVVGNPFAALALIRLPPNSPEAKHFGVYSFHHSALREKPLTLIIIIACFPNQ